MLESRIFEGKWEEMQTHAAELNGQWVIVTVVPKEEESREPAKQQTLAEALAGRIGRFRSGSGKNIARNHKEEFLKILDEKHQQGHL